MTQAAHYLVPEATCLNCGKAMDAAEATGGGRAPEPNDLSLCIYCGHLQAYGDDMKFRQLTGAEIVEIAGAPELLMAQRFAAGFRKWRAA